MDSLGYDKALSHRVSSIELERIKRDLDRKYDSDNSPIIKSLSLNELRTSPLKTPDMMHYRHDTEDRGIFMKHNSTSPIFSSSTLHESRDSETGKLQPSIEDDVYEAFSPSKYGGSPTSQASVVTAFRYFQDQCRKLESERSDAFAERESMRQQFDDLCRKSEHEKQFETSRREQELKIIKLSHEKVPFDIKQLEERIKRKKVELTEQDIQMIRYKQRYETLRDEIDNSSDLLKDFQSKVYDIENDLKESHIRIEEIQCRVEDIPDTTEIDLTAIKDDVYETEYSLSKEQRRNVRIESKIEILEKYLTSMLRVNADLCRVMETRAAASATSRAFGEQQQHQEEGEGFVGGVQLSNDYGEIVDGEDYDDGHGHGQHMRRESGRASSRERSLDRPRSASRSGSRGRSSGIGSGGNGGGSVGGDRDRDRYSRGRSTSSGRHRHSSRPSLSLGGDRLNLDSLDGVRSRLSWTSPQRRTATSMSASSVTSRDARRGRESASHTEWALNPDEDLIRPKRSESVPRSRSRSRSRSANLGRRGSGSGSGSVGIDVETEWALARLRSRSRSESMSPAQRRFLPASASSSTDFHVAAQASKAVRAAHRLEANITSRRKSMDGGAYALGTATAATLADELDYVNEQFRKFTRLLQRSPERASRDK